MGHSAVPLTILSPAARCAPRRLGEQFPIYRGEDLVSLQNRPGAANNEHAEPPSGRHSWQVTRSARDQPTSQSQRSKPDKHGEGLSITTFQLHQLATFVPFWWSVILTRVPGTGWRQNRLAMSPNQSGGFHLQLFNQWIRRQRVISPSRREAHSLVQVVCPVANRHPEVERCPAHRRCLFDRLGY